MAAGLVLEVVRRAVRSPEMRLEPPEPLVGIANLLRAGVPIRRSMGFGVPGGEWMIAPGFRGFSDPPPARDYCLGKSASCLRDSTGRMSCAEVEITKRLRHAGWRGGWINTYGGDPPIRWKRWTIDVGDILPLLPARYQQFGQWLSEKLLTGHRVGGTPDLLMVKGDAVVALECKRSQGDSAKTTQETWVRAVLVEHRLLPRDAFAVIWWERQAAPRTKPAVLPAEEPTRKHPNRATPAVSMASRGRIS